MIFFGVVFLSAVSANAQNFSLPPGLGNSSNENIDQILQQYNISPEIYDMLNSNASVDQFLYLQNLMHETQSALEIKTSPAYPGPQEEVLVSIESYHVNLNSSQIGWYLNGQLEKSGTGVKTFEFTTGNIGQSSRITMVVQTLDGFTFEKEHVINPSEMDIVWEAQTYTPPFYKGKALYSHQSGITLTAIPTITNSSGVKINPNNLIYKWTLNSSVLPNQSGYGKNTITLPGNTNLREITITAEASTLDGTRSVKEEVVLNSNNPKTLIYERHPLYGLGFNKALKNFNMESQEINLKAVPYFFDNQEDHTVNYTWMMNNQIVSSSGNPSLLTLRREGEAVSGTALISVSMTSLSKTRQRANDNVSLTFDSNN